MMRFVVFEGLARHISSENIYLSLERNMKCGQGFVATARWDRSSFVKMVLSTALINLNPTSIWRTSNARRQETNNRSV